MAALLGRKIGMTGIFNEQGIYIPCTLIEAGPCTVTQVKTMDTDGYEAIQVGFGAEKEKNLNKPQKGHFAKAGTAASRVVREFRTPKVADYKTGDVIVVSDL